MAFNSETYFGEQKESDKEIPTIKQEEVINPRELEKDDMQMEAAIAGKREQIKGAGDKFLSNKEASFGKRNEWMAKFAGLGAAIGGATELGLWGIKNGQDIMGWTQESVDLGWEATLATLAVAGGGALLGAAVGKFKDYWQRRKQKNGK